MENPPRSGDGQTNKAPDRGTKVIIAASNQHRTESATPSAPQKNKATKLTSPARRVSRSDRNLRGLKSRPHRLFRRVPQALPLSRPVPTRSSEGGGDLCTPNQLRGTFYCRRKDLPRRSSLAGPSKSEKPAWMKSSHSTLWTCDEPGSSIHRSETSGSDGRVFAVASSIPKSATPC